MSKGLGLPGALFCCVLAAAPGAARTIDTCFSPLGHCDQVLISWINAAVQSLDGAIYGLTHPGIAAALVRAHERGVRVRLIHDKSQSKDKRNVSAQLIQAGIPVRIQRGSGGGIQHHKFLIVDSTYVLTGSFNWTRNASRRNDENFVILDDQGPRFQAEFERLWSRSQAPKKPAPKKRRRKGRAVALGRDPGRDDRFFQNLYNAAMAFTRAEPPPEPRIPSI